MKLGQRTISRRAVVSTLYLLTCLCFGGSVSIPLYEMGLSICGLVCLLVVLWGDNTSRIEWSVKGFIIAFLSLVSLQLMPLPGMFWSRVSQGQFAESLSSLIELKGMRLSISIVPDATLYSLIAAAPAMIVLWLVAGLNRFERKVIAEVLIVAVIGQALLGIAQAAGAFAFSMYDYHHPNVAIGLFASRNHFADLILIGTALLFSVRQDWHQRYGGVVSEVVLHSFNLIFILAMIGSSSRSGLLLLFILIFIGYTLNLNPKRRIIFFTFTGFTAFLIFIYPEFFPKTGIVKTMLARFENIDDARWVIWEYSWVGLKSYFPWGAGIGTFSEAFKLHEPPFGVTPNYVNAAHNEYIQQIIEGGLIGLIFFIVWGIHIMVDIWDNRSNRMNIFAALGLILILIHAAFDYPFRVIGLNTLILCLVAFTSYPKRTSNSFDIERFSE